MTNRTEEATELPEFTHLIDLAAERLGGLAVAANDEFFAAKENLVKGTPPVFIPGKYTDRGKWMDGWETRRKRGPGHDWCVVRLGLAGEIHGVDIDTSHFLGNHPPFATLAAVQTPERLVHSSDFAALPWVEILPRSPLAPGARNFFAVQNRAAFTYVRLSIHPDGGVARLRVHGVVRPDFSKLLPDEMLDLAAVENGGLVLACNDMFFGPKDNLIMPGRGVNMGDGWETRRKRGPGHDWCLIRLGAPGQVRRVVIDTNHFKGNYPDRASLEGCYVPGREPGQLPDGASWQTVLPESRLEAHRIHEFQIDPARGPYTHVRLNIFPDGGVSRLRVFGTRERA